MRKFFHNFKIIEHSTNKFKFISLKSKIFYLSFLPSILIILLVLALSYTLSYGTLKETSLSREKQTLELISNQIDITLSSAESQLTNLITNNDIQEIFSKIKKSDTFPTDDEVIKIKNQLSNAVFKNTSISGVIIHSANNLSFKSNNKFLSLLDTQNINIEDFNYWKAPIFDNQQNPYMYLCKRMYNMQNGEFLGYVEIFVEEKLLSKNYTSSQFNKYSEIFIIDDDGKIISSVFKDKINSNIDTIQKERNSNVKNNELFNTKVTTQKSSSLTFFNKKLNSEIIAYVFIDDIIYEKSKLIITLIFLMILGIIFSYLLSKLISSLISKPIYSLYNSMNDIKNGNWDTNIPIKSYDEIGILSFKFKELIVYIKELIAQLNFEEKQKKKLEFELIQTQIKPHFLYNSLENISSLIELDMSDTAVDMISNLSKFYRDILSKGSSSIPILEELNLTISYLEIMKIRYTDVFDYYTYFDDDLQNAYCPKLILQPIVENSIYHGLKTSNFKGAIIISVFKENEKIKIIVEDTGIGMNDKTIKKIMDRKIDNHTKSGFALINTINRLELFYHKSYDFKIESSANNGTTINILIPCIEKEEYYERDTFS